MISLDNEQIYLLELIKASLFGKNPEIPEDANWEKIFEFAKSQCIVPLLAPSVPTVYREKWNAIAYQSKAHYMQMIYEQNALVKLLKDNGIPFAILKGTAASVYYPNPTLRSFGDIDVYICKENIEFARRILDINAYQFIKIDKSEYAYKKNGIDIELHIKISGTYYNDVEHIILEGLNNSVEYRIANTSFPGLPAYANGISLLGHIMHHLKTYGIGFRQIVDWMMFVHNELDDSAWENHFRKIASEAGLEKLAVTVTYMCRKWLGLPDDITWCNTADEEVADKLLIRILSDGNFGCDRVPYENIRKEIKKEGLFRFLQHTGLTNWSLAQKHAIFRPFAWLYQVFKYAGLGLARLFAGKKVFRNDKQNLQLEELWRRLE